MTSVLNWEGAGKPIRVGDKLPVYWFATKAAKESGKGVPTLREFYLQKLAGDLTLIRQYSPWNLRARPEAPLETQMTSPNFLYSKIKQLELKAVAEDKGAGRVSAIIRDDSGRILLARTQGQSRYDLPGGGVAKGKLTTEPIKDAMAREVFEELGMKAESLKHIDTLESRFSPKHKVEKFQIFEVDAKGKVSPGAEIAEYKWWDGKSRLDYPVAEFAKEAVNRSILRQRLIDNAAVVEVYKEVFSDIESSDSSFGFRVELLA